MGVTDTSGHGVIFKPLPGNGGARVEAFRVWRQETCVPLRAG